MNDEYENYLDKLLNSLNEQSEFANLTDEEKCFAFSGDKTSPVFKRKITEALPFIEQFCKRYNVALSKLDVTMEEGYYELCCSFSDNLGFYTLQGLKNSLD